MGDLDVAGPAGWVAVTLPLAMLLTLIAILTFRQRRRARAKAALPKSQVGRYGQPVDRMPAKSRSAAPVEEGRPGTLTKTAPPPAADPGPEVRPLGKAPAAPPLSQIAALSAELQRAEQKGDERKLPQLYLGLGEARLATGSAGEAAELFRKCIRAAIRSPDPLAHAKARLELGDLAHAAGDMTTACEHWQIARGLYFEARRAPQLEAVEGRMQRHGCPTDWVLNDF